MIPSIDIVRAPLLYRPSLLHLLRRKISTNIIGVLIRCCLLFGDIRRVLWHLGSGAFLI